MIETRALSRYGSTGFNFVYSPTSGGMTRDSPVTKLRVPTETVFPATEAVAPLPGSCRNVAVQVDREKQTLKPRFSLHRLKG
jgi:hypothetical protein